jgi:hypothetical protein
LIKGLRNERPGHSTIGTTTSGWSNCGRREQVKAKITSLIWQVLDLNFSQRNFLRMQDPIGQRVQGTACKQSLADSEFRELKLNAEQF